MHVVQLFFTIKAWAQANGWSRDWEWAFRSDAEAEKVMRMEEEELLKELEEEEALKNQAKAMRGKRRDKQ